MPVSWARPSNQTCPGTGNKLRFDVQLDQTMLLAILEDLDAAIAELPAFT
jgi:hypothetical protein